MHAEGGRELVLLFGSVIGPYYSAWACVPPSRPRSKLVIPKFIFVGLEFYGPPGPPVHAEGDQGDE
jgi:hypothetical protein